MNTLPRHSQSSFKDAIVIWRMADVQPDKSSPDLIETHASLTPNALSIYVRLHAMQEGWHGSLLSLFGEGDETLCALSANWDEAQPILIFDLTTDRRESPLRLTSTVTDSEWHDVVIRYMGARLEMFLDGALVDEEWPIGGLRSGALGRCHIGAEQPYDSSAGGTPKVDQVALWDRALADDEIARLSGKEQVVFPASPSDTSMQYWRSPGHNTNAGDCMPFFHDGCFHLFYLFDRRHHRSKWGLGAHQWAHASTTDLVHWEHHAMAIPITQDWEGSICTGSVFFHEGTYYAFYATRMPDGTQHLGLATSTDGIHFSKQEPNPFASPEEGYDPMHYRDPEVFRNPETGLFHMLVTARLTDGRDGCLAQLISEDLRSWELAEPFIIPGRVTDCPHLFEWNGWYYLFAEYVYWISRKPLGPWTQPTPNRLDVLYVPKTASFGDNRRLLASWLPDGGWGGNVVFRELIQHPDGRLGTKFVDEMVPLVGERASVDLIAITDTVAFRGKTIRLSSVSGVAIAALLRVPSDFRVSLQVHPGKARQFGVCVKGQGEYGSGCEIRFEPSRQRVQIGALDGKGLARESETAIQHVADLDRPFSLEVIVKGDIVDVCIDQRRTIIARHKASGDRLFLFGDDVIFEETDVLLLLE